MKTNAPNKKSNNWYYRLFFILARRPNAVIGKDRNGKKVVKKIIYTYYPTQPLIVLYLLFFCVPVLLLCALWGEKHRLLISIIAIIWLTMVLVNYFIANRNSPWIPYMKYFEQEPKDVRRKKAIVPLLIFLSLVTIFILEVNYIIKKM